MEQGAAQDNAEADNSVAETDNSDIPSQGQDIAAEVVNGIWTRTSRGLQSVF